MSAMDRQRVPAVIIISAQGDERDKIRALDMGADDYLAKPFGADELLARVRAVLRRSEPDAGPSLVVRVEDVNEEIGIDLPHENGIETLGGFVYEQLGEVPSVAAGMPGGQLGAAGEAVGEHDGVLVRVPGRGPQPALRARRRYAVVTPFEAEVPGQAATPRIQH